VRHDREGQRRDVGVEEPVEAAADAVLLRDDGCPGMSPR
jgi:hypothetical protein